MLKGSEKKILTHVDPCEVANHFLLDGEFMSSIPP